LGSAREELGGSSPGTGEVIKWGELMRRPHPPCRPSSAQTARRASCPLQPSSMRRARTRPKIVTASIHPRASRREADATDIRAPSHRGHQNCGETATRWSVRTIPAGLDPADLRRMADHRMVRWRLSHLGKFSTLEVWVGPNDPSYLQRRKRKGGRSCPTSRCMCVAGTGTRVETRLGEYAAGKGSEALD
jgi:hypothetical protein